MSADNSPAEPRHRSKSGICSWRTGQGREYLFREPSEAGGVRLWAMTRESQGSDLNASSSYQTLTGHFIDTSVVAERNRKTAGFVSAFVRPSAPETLFIWQIAVTESERGRGLARGLLHHLLSRPVCREVETVEAAVTKSNQASRALFAAVARDLQVPVQVGQDMESRLFPDGVDEGEDLVRVGPLPPRRRSLLSSAGLEGDEGHEPSNDQYAAEPQPLYRDRAGRHRSA